MSTQGIILKKQEWVCPVCKFPLEQSGKGRPRMYHVKCRQFEQACSDIDDLIPDILPGRGAEGYVRSRLWNLANLANILRYEKEPQDENKN